MLTANNTIFSSQNALNGQWRNIQNWVAFSLQINGLEGNVWVEVSNDPNVVTDGANISAPSAPVLSQYTPLSDGGLAPFTGRPCRCSGQHNLLCEEHIRDAKQPKHKWWHERHHSRRNHSQHRNKLTGHGWKSFGG